LGKLFSHDFSQCRDEGVPNLGDSSIGHYIKHGKFTGKILLRMVIGGRKFLYFCMGGGGAGSERMPLLKHSRLK